MTRLEGSFSSRDGTELYTCSIRPPQPLAVVGIVHGYGDHSGCYAEGMGRLAAAGFEAQAFDFRGHGRSAGRRGFVKSWSEFFHDLYAFVDRLGRAAGSLSPGEERPVFLLGQSHGALLLTHAALTGLNRVQGMIFTGPYLRSALTVPTWKLAFGRAVDRMAPWYPIPSDIRSEMLTADPEILEIARKDPLTLRIATPRWFFSAQKAQVEALARAPDFRLPVLIVQGGRDPVADPKASELFFQRLGSDDKTYREFPEMRHEPLRELGRDAVWDEIVPWLRQRAA